MTVNNRGSYLEMAITCTYIREISDKKSANNEGRFTDFVTLRFHELTSILLKNKKFYMLSFLLSIVL